MNKWQSSRALKRVIVEIKTLSAALSTSLESVISTPADEDKPLQDLRTPTIGFACIPGMLQLLELPDLALLAKEIHVSISELLEEKKQLPGWKLNPRLETAYVALGSMDSMLQAGLEKNSDNFEQIIVLLNRVRNSRNVAQVFSSTVLLEKQDINYRKVFEEKPQLLQDLMEKQLLYYNKACKILLKNPADKKAREVVIKVADNLRLLLRDYMAGTRWGLSSALLAKLPEENLDQALFRILAGFSWSLQFTNNDSVMLRHDEMSGVLDKDLENSVLDEIARVLDITSNSTPEMALVRNWLKLGSSETGQNDSNALFNVSGDIADTAQIRYHSREARNKTIAILAEHITSLLDSINEIADEKEIDSTSSVEVQKEIRRLGEVVRFMGLETLATNIEDDLAGAFTQQPRGLLFTMAKTLVSSAIELGNYKESHAVNLSSEVKQEVTIHAMNSARLHTLQAVIGSINKVIKNLDLLAQDNTAVLEETRATLGQLSRVLQLLTLPEQSRQFQIAQDYITELTQRTTLETNTVGFERVCQLMINSLWYFEQLVLGREADSAIYLEKSAGFARELLADISLRKQGGSNDSGSDSDDSANEKLRSPLQKQKQKQKQEQEQEIEKEFSFAANESISASNEIDEEHKQKVVFSNEFDEILLCLCEELSDLQSVGQQTGRVRNCCRLFHTLGGSGRSVAQDVAAVSVAMERLFDGLTAKPQGITDEIMGFTEEVLDVLALLRDGILDPGNDNAFKAGSFKASINNICNQAVAYEKALTGNCPAMETRGPYSGITQASTALEKYMQSQDPLLTGFLHEARDLHARIKEGQLLLGVKSDSAEALNQISTALYLLQGAAEMAECHAVGSVTSALLLATEKLTPAVLEANGGDRAFRTILDDCVDWLGNAMSSLEKGQPLDDCEALIIAIKEYPPVTPAVDKVNEDIGLQENHEQHSSSPEQLLFLPAPVQATEPEPQPQPQPQPQPASTGKHDAELEAFISPVLANESNETPVDQELLAVFVDEMTELLQELDDLYLHWQQNPQDTTILEKYLRILHTLKGSSALAQEDALSKASHDYESFVISASKANGFDADFFTRCDIHLHELHKICSLYSRDANGFITRKSLVAQAGQELKPDLSNERAALHRSEELIHEIEFHENAEAENSEYRQDTQEADKTTLESSDSDTSSGADKTDLAVSEPATVSPLKSAATAGNTNSQNQAETFLPGSAAQEQVRVSSQLLGYLLNDADEINFSRNRLEKSFHDIGNLLIEMDETLIRLNSFVKRVDENASQSAGSGVEFGHYAGQDSVADEFDVLEMDRYTELQEMSLSLTEDYEDLQDIRRNLSSRLKEIDQALMGQQRLTNSLQDGLISSQMLPFSSIVPRLRRLVRQTGRELNKDIRIEVQNQQGNLDKNILQAVITPFEHILRNAIDHGIESAQDRVKAGKEAQATITLMVARQGASISVVIKDDGQGINVEKVKSRAVATGLLEEGAIINDEEAIQLIFQPGFSTAEQVSTISGRGVGLDVVKNQINQVGGAVEVVSEAGKGTAFIMTLPLTSSLNRALLFRIQQTPYVVLMDTLAGVLVEKLARIYQSEGDTVPPVFEYGGEQYEYLYLGKLIDAGLDPRPESVDAAITLLLVKGKQKNHALHIDSIIESRDLVVKSFGKQFTSMPGISGGVIMPDGNVAIVLDLASLVNLHHGNKKSSLGSVFLQSGPGKSGAHNKKIMVVDDSITVRKVTTGILERNGMDVISAKNGIEAIALLETYLPDVILLDIEMPKMDGFEVASYIRKQESPVRDIPIIMITSRIGEKHRNRAGKLGVNEYLCKPFQEKNLIETIQSF